MLLVAIPKSASTSLMKTLALLHNRKAKQDSSMRESMPKPREVRYLANWHSDVREYSAELVDKMCSKRMLFKQHVFPSENNLALLRGKRIVVLLRDPQEVIDAYFRAEKAGIHKPRRIFRGVDTVEVARERAIEVGLLDDLRLFHERWKDEAHDNADVLIVDYRDLLESPTRTINEIERHWGVAGHDG